MKKKTDLKTQALRFITKFETKHQYPPTGDEIAAGLHISRSYAYVILDRLEAEKLIVRPRISGQTVGRGLRLTSAAMRALQESM